MALLAGCSSDKFVAEDGGDASAVDATIDAPQDAADDGATGIAWTKVAPPVPQNLGTPNLNAVWVRAPDDVWVGGEVANEGFIAHWDGAKFDKSWLAHSGLPATNALPVPSGPITAIRGTSSTEVVAVGSASYRLNGANWSMLPTIVGGDFGGLFHAADNARTPPRRYFGVLATMPLANTPK